MAKETVEMEDEAFNPVRKTVEPPSNVIWKNTGSVNHSVDSVQFHETANQWQLQTQTLRPEDSVVYAFDQEGIYEYYCSIHGKDMCGAILVGDVSLPEPLPCDEG